MNRCMYGTFLVGGLGVLFFLLEMIIFYSNKTAIMSLDDYIPSMIPQRFDSKCQDHK